LLNVRKTIDFPDILGAIEVKYLIVLTFIIIFGERVDITGLLIYLFIVSLSREKLGFDSSRIFK
jgi:hypothetical protein